MNIYRSPSAEPHPTAGWSALVGEPQWLLPSIQGETGNPTAHDPTYSDYGSLCHWTKRDAAGQLWITNVPTVEPMNTSGVFFARLGTGPQQLLARAAGCWVSTTEELAIMYNLPNRLHIAPVVLPTAAMIQAAGIFRRKGLTPADQALKDQQYQSMVQNEVRVPNMCGKDWAIMHDAAVGKLLTAAGWDGSQPVDNCGKKMATTHPGALNEAVVCGWLT